MEPVATAAAVECHQSSPSQLSGWVRVGGGSVIEELWQEKISELISMSDEEFQKWSRGARKLAEEYVEAMEIEKLYADLFG